MTKQEDHVEADAQCGRGFLPPSPGNFQTPVENKLHYFVYLFSLVELHTCTRYMFNLL